MGESLAAKRREDAKVNPDVMSLRFEGIEFSVAEEPPVVVLRDYPSFLVGRFRAAAELGRLAAMWKIHWYAAGPYQPDLRVCPSHLIVKEDRARVGHDWSNALAR